MLASFVWECAASRAAFLNEPMSWMSRPEQGLHNGSSVPHRAQCRPEKGMHAGFRYSLRRTIIDFGRFIAGPCGGMLLADMGANVCSS
jgi:CoA-transferase family III